MPIVVRLFEPINPVAKEGRLLPPYEATAAMPRCLFVQHSSSPPGKMGYLKTEDKEAFFVICEKCAAGLSDAELEAKVIESLLADETPPAVAVAAGKLDVEAPPPTKWATAAAQAWVKPLTDRTPVT